MWLQAIAKHVNKALEGYCHEENSNDQKGIVPAVVTPGPMKCVGLFLDKVLPMKLPEIPPSQPQQHCVVHYTSGYSQEHLMKFILKIFKGKFPELCQMWWCDEMTTEDELEYFVNRVEGVSSTYMLLEINSLPIMLQEVRNLMYVQCINRNIYISSIRLN